MTAQREQCEAEVQTDMWPGLYRESWHELIVPEAFAHPAKMAPGLCQRIFDHAKAEGWLQENAVVLDPFMGIGTTALQALMHGCAFVGVELEHKFFMLAEANLSTWMADYRTLPGWGPWALCMLGDSRHLTALLPGQAKCIVASPPYSGNEKSDYLLSSDGKTRRRDVKRGYRQGHGCFRGSETYGQSEGQLGSLPVGMAPGVGMIVASPPYAEAIQNGRSGIDKTKGVDPRKAESQGVRRLEELAEGYGTTAGQLGNAQGDTFWSAARTILEQCFAILRPGGHAIWVVKAYVREGTVVDFPGEWRALCEHVGFVTLHEHHALLTEDHGMQETLFGAGPEQMATARMSFFRRLHTRKYPHLAIPWEVVYCMQKPGADARGEGADCVVSSPPYADSDTNTTTFGLGKARRGGTSADRNKGDYLYGSSPGQLGRMPAGDTSLRQTQGEGSS